MGSSHQAHFPGSATQAHTWAQPNLTEPEPPQGLTLARQGFQPTRNDGGDNPMTAKGGIHGGFHNQHLILAQHQPRHQRITTVMGAYATKHTPPTPTHYPQPSPHN
ncbi:hypothetical protein V6N13_098553 [Hibiscus sabdariffa]|uniref:Uncharacterized protein n=1 Tax=Hibiscus sabdariffa TaxID=183260 RepID=A0ABR2EFV4_9ROSI